MCDYAVPSDCCTFLSHPDVLVSMVHLLTVLFVFVPSLLTLTSHLFLFHFFLLLLPSSFSPLLAEVTVVMCNLKGPFPGMREIALQGLRGAYGSLPISWKSADQGMRSQLKVKSVQWVISGGSWFFRRFLFMVQKAYIWLDVLTDY